MKIGVYGGTFNPPHLGHVTAARAVSELLKLDKLLFIPAGLPPHKPLPEGTPSPEQRLEMTRLAAEQTGLGDRVETLDLEILREGRSYTSETLELLRQQYPDDELWLLMGTDMFLTIQTWHDPASIFELAGIAAFGRTEEDTEELFAVQRDRCLLHGAAAGSGRGKGRHAAAAGGVWLYPAPLALWDPRGSQASAAEPAAAGGSELSEV